MEEELKNLAISLYEINALKFGEFVTKIGIKTPVYFDLRVIVSHPKIMHKLSLTLWKLAKDTKDISHICGVPYTALPLATLISVDSNTPMLIRRKEAKSHGTKKLIEGQYKKGDVCVIIEDVVTSGSSILETVRDLRTEGLEVNECLVIVDREQGGRQNLENNGIRMKSLYTLTQLMELLQVAGKINAKVVQEVQEYLAKSQISLNNKTEEKPDNRLKLDFLKRAKLSKNPVTSRLLTLMSSKESTLCLAADLTSSEAILQLAELAGPHIPLLKIHVDVIEDFTDTFLQRLKELARKHQFLVMEDRKFGDIGNTVALQFGKGVFRIADWADLVTAHTVAGEGILDGLKAALNGNSSSCKGVFLVVEMSSKGTLTSEEYVKASLEIAEKHSEIVVGVVSQRNVCSRPDVLQLTPGVKLVKSDDALGQKYNTPEAVVNAGADLAVVGRGIIEAKDQLAAILKYKEALWRAYESRLQD